MMDPAGGDWMGVPSQSQQPMWSDPMKQEQEGFWKQQHQQVRQTLIVSMNDILALEWASEQHGRRKLPNAATAQTRWSTASDGNAGPNASWTSWGLEPGEHVSSSPTTGTS